MTPPVKLIARDPEDLAVISACMQDALIPLNEMRYLPQERRFVLVANRFRWERAVVPGEEAAPTKDASFESDEDFGSLQRTNAGLCIDRVVAVRSRGIDRSRPDDFLSLLSLQLDGDKLSFLFAGGGVIQVEVEGLSLYLSDLGKAWPTQWQPDHALDAAETKAARR
jgi:Protein of unknown function (DUF2948)